MRAGPLFRFFGGYRELLLITTKYVHLLYWPRHEKTCLRGFANNTGADQSAHPRSLISAFVIHFV